MRPLLWVALAVANSALGLPPAARQEEDHSDPADALLAEAEEQASRGRYEKARSTYEKLAEKYPDTRAGRIAARRSRPSAYLGSADLVRHGPSENRVDVLLMGDGYTLTHMKAFDELAEDIPPVFERETTFREYFTYMNFIRVSLVSAEDGVDGFGREYDTALGARTRGTEAGHVGLDVELARTRMSEVGEHDGLAIVFVKLGILGTGGGGIAVVGGRDITTTIHEWGHAFGRLDDEYSTHTHDRGIPRSGINLSTSEAPERAPWAHWLAAKVPGIGLYEGGAGQVRDVWRPTASSCIMNDAETFCRVCREALVLRIHALVDPIDSHSPPTVPVDSGVALMMRDGESLDFEVRVMRPESHRIEVRWWVLEEEQAPRQRVRAVESRYRTGRKRSGDRRDRGALPEIRAKPVLVSKNNRSGVHTFTLKNKDLSGPGRYRVLCRAVDTTRLPGEKWPWVLADPDHLLQSERGWWVDYRETR